MADFIIFDDPSRGVMLLNLDQVRREETVTGGFRFIFDNQDQVIVGGKDVMQVWERLKERAVALNGERVPPAAQPPVAEEPKI